jgi:UV DNA damage repair endonuclease
MQKTLLAIIISLSVPNLTSATEQTRASKPSFKGVELYSWRVSSNRWHFASCVGTNRSKAIREIKRKCQQINDLSSLKNHLSKLAVGEYVMWSSPYPELTLPPDAVLQEVQAHALTLEIKLTIAK